MSKEPDISVDFAGLKLSNPVFTASGTCGYADELAEFMDVNSLGGFITKSITLEAREGNRPQRTIETAAGMLNSIGLANVGLDRFCQEKKEARSAIYRGPPDKERTWHIAGRPDQTQYVHDDFRKWGHIYTRL